MIQPLDNYDEIIRTSALRMEDEPRLNPIPTNIILNKVITGWGATYSEIKADRHSIILLPHKTQIYSKHDFHRAKEYTHPVTEAEKLHHLINHIKNSKGRKVKFLSTPEGLRKVIQAIIATGGDPYNDYFILLDECHKLTKDINYRVNISAAMHYFFDFTNKAMISATPFKPTDPRFYYFKMVKVQHEREIKKDIKLQYVNNTGAAFKEYIDDYNGELLFIFFNTLNGIDALIKNCNMSDTANVYCSTDGVEDFRIKGFHRAYNAIDPKSVAKFNFLTSSFFNGLDITGLTQVPDILILTDIKYVDHTIIDPNTDTYQILGRFRPENYQLDSSDRYRTATHIINVKHNAKFKLEDRAVNDFEVSQANYIKLLELQATTTDTLLRDEVYGEALKRIRPYANLLNEYGDFDYFKYDNYLYEERLKMCYGHDIAPGLSYIYSGLYNIEETRKIYTPEEFESMSKSMKRYSKQAIRWVCEQLILNESQQGTEGAEEYYQMLLKRFPMVLRAVTRLGYDRIEELKYNSTQIEKAMLKKDINEKLLHNGMIDAVYRVFIVAASYPVSEVKAKLVSLFEEFGIEARAKSTDIGTYFTYSEYNGYKALLKRELKALSSEEEHEDIEEIDGIKKRSVRMYRLLDKKHNMINLNSTRTAQFITKGD